jgi:phosphomethylpyrimidine synthase
MGEFARLQNQSAEGFIAVDGSNVGVAGAEMSQEDIDAGFAQMSKVYDETGRELYMGAGDREHD